MQESCQMVVCARPENNYCSQLKIHLCRTAKASESQTAHITPLEVSWSPCLGWAEMFRWPTQYQAGGINVMVDLDPQAMVCLFAANWWRRTLRHLCLRWIHSSIVSFVAILNLPMPMDPDFCSLLYQHSAWQNSQWQWKVECSLLTEPPTPTSQSWSCSVQRNRLKFLQANVQAWSTL